jgi:hypothetical protein
MPANPYQSPGTEKSREPRPDRSVRRKLARASIIASAVVVLIVVVAMIAFALAVRATHH